jgi:hypothetical protein
MNAPLKTSWLALGLLCLALPAAAQTFSGRFDDPGNTALFSSDLSAASFDDEYAIANNVALYSFTVAVTGSVSIVSTGFAAGGTDPYFTLFQGATGTAAFVDSNYLQAFSTGGDFTYSGVLAAGEYQFALGTFANMSVAENSGSGALSDGFIWLGVPDSLGNMHYSVTVSTGIVTTPVPEPETAALMALGLAMTMSAIARRRRARRR